MVLHRQPFYLGRKHRQLRAVLGGSRAGVNCIASTLSASGRSHSDTDGKVFFAKVCNIQSPHEIVTIVRKGSIK